MMFQHDFGPVAESGFHGAHPQFVAELFLLQKHGFAAFTDPFRNFAQFLFRAVGKNDQNRGIIRRNTLTASEFRIQIFQESFELRIASDQHQRRLPAGKTPVGGILNEYLEFIFPDRLPLFENGKINHIFSLRRFKIECHREFLQTARLNVREYDFFLQRPVFERKRDFGLFQHLFRVIDQIQFGFERFSRQQIPRGKARKTGQHRLLGKFRGIVSRPVVLRIRSVFEDRRQMQGIA